MSSNDLFDPASFRVELKAALEFAATQFTDADYAPLRFTSASVKRSSVALHTLAQHIGLRAAARFDELEARVAAVEQRKSVEFRGTWNANTQFGEGDLVQHQSQLWLCTGNGVRSKPGSEAGSWRLAAKRDFAK